MELNTPVLIIPAPKFEYEQRLLYIWNDISTKCTIEGREYHLEAKDWIYRVGYTDKEGKYKEDYVRDWCLF